MTNHRSPLLAAAKRFQCPAHVVAQPGRVDRAVPVAQSARQLRLRDGFGFDQDAADHRLGTDDAMRYMGRDDGQLGRLPGTGVHTDPVRQSQRQIDRISPQRTH